MKGFSTAAALIVALLVNFGSASARAGHERRITHSGRLTWFNLPQGNDACGQPIPTGLPAVHIGKDLWRDGLNCGQWMSITVGGKTTTGVVTGHCDTCTVDQIDVAPGLFSEFDNTDVGVLECTWNFLNKAYVPDLPECEY
ncbi:putative effector protein [Ceratobasidium theobromae]|uniref:Putative effector protein n=1 Tax=Ceratobasidium theobromae TaxID=1582974 RepID=A0A5N5QBG6_9AGAM|nr:putative effector protein [Ceratobasidium theobromae]